MTREDCLDRFTKAVRDGKRGYYAEATEIVESVRKKHGDSQAAIAKKELWGAIRSDRWDKK